LGLQKNREKFDENKVENDFFNKIYKVNTQANRFLNPEEVFRPKLTYYKSQKYKIPDISTNSYNIFESNPLLLDKNMINNYYYQKFSKPIEPPSNSDFRHFKFTELINKKVGVVRNGFDLFTQQQTLTEEIEQRITNDFYNSLSLENLIEQSEKLQKSNQELRSRMRSRMYLNQGIQSSKKVKDGKELTNRVMKLKNNFTNDPHSQTVNSEFSMGSKDRYLKTTNTSNNKYSRSSFFNGNDCSDMKEEDIDIISNKRIKLINYEENSENEHDLQLSPKLPKYESKVNKGNRGINKYF